MNVASFLYEGASPSFVSRWMAMLTASCLWLVSLGTVTSSSIPKHLLKLLLFLGGSPYSLAWHGLPVHFLWAERKCASVLLSQLMGFRTRSPLSSVWAFHLRPCWQHLPSSATPSLSPRFCATLGQAWLTEPVLVRPRCLWRRWLLLVLSLWRSKEHPKLLHHCLTRFKLKHP